MTFDFKAIVKPFEKVAGAVARHLPEILTGGAIVGLGITTYCSAKTIPTMERIIEEAHEVNAPAKETAKDIVKVGLPLAAAITMTTACILGAHACHVHREMMLMAANKDLARKYLEYKTAAMRTLGAGELTVASAAASAHINREDIPDDYFEECRQTYGEAKDIDFSKIHNEQEKLDKKPIVTDSAKEIHTDDGDVLTLAHQIDPNALERSIIGYDQYFSKPFVTTWKELLNAETEFNQIFEDYNIVNMSKWAELIHIPSTYQSKIDVITGDDSLSEYGVPRIEFANRTVYKIIDGVVVPVVMIYISSGASHEMTTDDYDMYGTSFDPTIDVNRIRFADPYDPNEILAKIAPPIVEGDE